ncbi:hypothetical protein DEA8626_04123 [Defluviimonas aquaemixtae]|uniref:Secreted protein n=1 Tax=Albidovulum aquaemixtae TaxID=1542388 RepID=A0A2R8BP03_9RHOB|nr:hypothetical protein [Defluviimonas aquaemixtae]SPH25087.1 hypothetical protein DEA8626_04123 [Defluviimonas aquaemixtae]
MKRTITAVATAAMLSVSTLTGAAFAAESEMNMVVDAVTRLLVELRIPSDNVGDLTIDQVRRIVQIADSHEMGDATRAQVLKIIDE